MKRSVRVFGIAFFAGVFGVGCNSIVGIEEPIPSMSSGTSGAHGGAAGTAAGTGGSSGSGTTPKNDSGTSEPAADVEPRRWAQWPMPNPVSEMLPNAQNYDSNSIVGVVLDLVTGLQWQQKVEDGAHAWADAASYCDSLAAYGGSWRLPTRIELFSIVDYTRPNPVIDPGAFPETPQKKFWTASTFAADDTKAWAVNFEFNDGITVSEDKTQEFPVRCVR